MVRVLPFGAQVSEISLTRSKDQENVSIKGIVVSLLESFADNWLLFSRIIYIFRIYSFLLSFV